MSSPILKNDKIISDLVGKYKKLAKNEVAMDSSLRNSPTFKLSDNKIGFSVSEVAYMSGFSVRTIARAISIKELPSKKFGRRRILSKIDVEAWLNQKE